MKNRILIFITCLILFNCKYSLGQSQQCRYQEDFTLDWSFFRAEIDVYSSFGAVSSLGIGYFIKEYDSLIAINIGAFFYPDSSWVRSETPAGLIHEIYHFKIAEIARRYMLKELTEIKLNYKFIIELLENRLINYSWYHEGEQDHYDRTTDHGLDTLKQKEFEIKIDNELKSLEEYKKQYLLLFLDKDNKIKFSEMSNTLPIDTTGRKD